MFSAGTWASATGGRVSILTGGSTSSSGSLSLSSSDSGASGVSGMLVLRSTVQSEGPGSISLKCCIETKG